MIFREILSRKGFAAYAYAEDALPGWRNKADIQAPFFQQEIDAVWRSSCASNQAADYVVLYARK